MLVEADGRIWFKSETSRFTTMDWSTLLKNHNVDWDWEFPFWFAVLCYMVVWKHLCSVFQHENK